VLVYEDAPRPMITDDDVLIKVAATAVNPVDRSFRAGYMQGMMPFPLPLTLGFDLALSCQRQSSPVHHCPLIGLILGIGKANIARIVLTEVVTDKPY
jgi:hypothetical protein